MNVWTFYPSCLIYYFNDYNILAVFLQCTVQVILILNVKMEKKIMFPLFYNIRKKQEAIIIVWFLTHPPACTHTHTLVCTPHMLICTTHMQCHLLLLPTCVVSYSSQTIQSPFLLLLVQQMSLIQFLNLTGKKYVNMKKTYQKKNRSFS